MLDEGERDAAASQWWITADGPDVLGVDAGDTEQCRLRQAGWLRAGDGRQLAAVPMRNGRRVVGCDSDSPDITWPQRRHAKQAHLRWSADEAPRGAVEVFDHLADGPNIIRGVG